MNKLEAVARAICKTRGIYPTDFSNPNKPLKVHINAAQAAIEAMEEWQPIDTAPKDGAYILIYFRDMYSENDEGGWKYNIKQCYWSEGAERPHIWQGRPSSHWDALYWQPLPQPPKER